MSPDLASLHWLTVSFRIDFKILPSLKHFSSLMSQSAASDPLAGLCWLFLSQDFGVGASAVRAPHLRNRLPAELRLQNL